MAIASQEMFQICRFCLCQDEALLIPLEDILDFTLAFQDVSAVTGLEINEDNIALYAMCLECTNKLKSSVAFREACRSNESHFQELCAVLSASFKESRIKIIDTIELSDSSDESIDFDLNTRDVSFADSAESSQINAEQRARLIEEREETAQRTDAEGEESSYSANYILPGETLYSEDEDTQYWIDWVSSLNPRAPPPVKHLREKGKRKHPLCDICGRMVAHIPSHVIVHKEECTYTCPQCPFKTKHKHNIQPHIDTVHKKTVMKTCEICGKGFVHHKTYRYHMLTHQSEGETFECVDCSSTFSNSVYLRDHINRLHNAGKPMRRNDAGERIRRRRTRLYDVMGKSKN